MKHVLLVSAIAMMSLNAHAATSACKKLALKAVDVDITSVRFNMQSTPRRKAARVEFLQFSRKKQAANLV